MNDDAGVAELPPVDREEAVRLLGEAARAAGRAYAPYSGFPVGAALLAGDGRAFTGCNVENASYGLSICAERVAVFKAVSEGARHLRAIAVGLPDGRPVPPCGACCQVLAEFNPEMQVILPGAGGEPAVLTLDRFLAAPFRPGHLAAPFRPGHLAGPGEPRGARKARPAAGEGSA